MPVREALTPGRISPMRPVPAEIIRPEYVGKSAPTPSTDPWVQTPEVVEATRIALTAPTGPVTIEIPVDVQRIKIAPRTLARDERNRPVGGRRPVI